MSIPFLQILWSLLTTLTDIFMHSLFCLYFRLSCVNWRKPKCRSPSTEVSGRSDQVKPAHTFCCPPSRTSVWWWCSWSFYSHWRETRHIAAWSSCDQCNTKYDYFLKHWGAHCKKRHKQWFCFAILISDIHSPLAYKTLLLFQFDRILGVLDTTK